MRNTVFATALLIVAAASGTAALGQNKPSLAYFDSIDKIVGTLNDMGRTTSVSTNDVDEPVISVNDNFYWISLQSCENGTGCTSATFYTVGYEGITIDLECANSWHAIKLLGAVWVDDDPPGVPWLYESISLVGAMTTEHVIDVVMWWETHVEQFDEMTQECSGNTGTGPGSGSGGKNVK